MAEEISGWEEVSRDNKGSGGGGSGEVMGRDCLVVRGDCPKSVVEISLMSVAQPSSEKNVVATLLVGWFGISEPRTGAKPLQGLRGFKIIHG